ncbi:hypothetical protein ACFXNW_18405 [Nocardia sp. NPDC059180]|uniref:hypothetical protein n=1 Tax=Nocardia sp. NPDC059180 TaxID=3346761 RepID=UPI0036837A6A
MTDYDQPGITNPENVDAFTHQQIRDAFDTVAAESTGDMVTNWTQARTMLRDSTTAMVQAVRSAVDGQWTGASADAAASAVVHYSGQADGLADMFEGTAATMANTAVAVTVARSFLPPVVTVTADPNTDPAAYAAQDRAATNAQHEARQVMQTRYVVPLTEYDAQLPTYPPAVSPVSDSGPSFGPTTSSAATDSAPPTETEAPAPDGAEPEVSPRSDQPGQSEASGLVPDHEGQPSQNVPTDQPIPGQTAAASADSTRPNTTNPLANNAFGSDAGRQSPGTPFTPSGPDVAGRAPGSIDGSPGPGGRTDLGSPGRTPAGTGAAPAPGAPSPGRSIAPVGPVQAPAASSTGSSSATPAGQVGPHGAVPPGAARGRTDDQEKKDKKVDLQHRKHTRELLGRNRFVPPTIGE